MRKFLPLLALLLTIGACSGDDGPPPVAEPEDLSLVKISGDAQTAPVKTSTPSGALVSYAIADNPNLLPEPLVAKIVIDESGSLALMPTGPSYSLSATDPSFAQIPTGTVVTFRVTDERCGDSFISADVPDDSALVSTFWEKGTIAGVVCEMEARIVVNDVPQVSEVFTATFQPGAVERVQLDYTSSDPYLHPGDTIDLRGVVQGGRDAYQNDIPRDSLLALPPNAVRWQWSDARQGSDYELPIETGWTVIAPDTAGFQGGPRRYSREIPGCVPDGTNNCTIEYVGRSFHGRLTVWVDNAEPASLTLEFKFDDPDDPTNQ